MDPLDLILLEAWNRVSKKVREQRVLALKRSRRRFKGILTRPMREWCLVVRASDTRITAGNALIDPPLPRRGPDAIAAHEPHTLLLTGRLIRELTKPVSIDWPGVTLERAAAICGRDYQSLYGWMREGVFKVNRYREFRFPENSERRGCYARLDPSDQRYRPQEIGRPYVWTPAPIDPNNVTGRPPHRVWGTLWQWMWEKMPEDYELVVRREPRFRLWNGKRVFRGWEIVCPGRLNAQHEFKGCGRRCMYLYGPQTVWTLAKAMASELGDEWGFHMPDDSGLVGQWFPGLSDPINATGPRSFACKRCWDIRSVCMTGPTGWNEFVTHISGGLLYGRDVPRPLDICPIARKTRADRKRRGTAKAMVRRTNDARSMPRHAAGESAPV